MKHPNCCSHGRSKSSKRFDPSHFSPFGTNHQKEKRRKRTKLLIVLLDVLPINVISFMSNPPITTVIIIIIVRGDYRPSLAVHGQSMTHGTSNLSQGHPKINLLIGLLVIFLIFFLKLRI